MQIRDPFQHHFYSRHSSNQTMPWLQKTWYNKWKGISSISFNIRCAINDYYLTIIWQPKNSIFSFNILLNCPCSGHVFDAINDQRKDTKVKFPFKRAETSLHQDDLKFFLENFLFFFLERRIWIGFSTKQLKARLKV